MDPLWLDADREKALAYRAYARTVCPRCGTRDEDWDPACGGAPDAFVADDVRCEGCARLEQLARQIPEGRHGVTAGLFPRQLVEARLAAKDQPAAADAEREALLSGGSSG